MTPALQPWLIVPLALLASMLFPDRVVAQRFTGGRPGGISGYRPGGITGNFTGASTMPPSGIGTRPSPFNPMVPMPQTPTTSVTPYAPASTESKSATQAFSTGMVIVVVGVVFFGLMILVGVICLIVQNQKSPAPKRRRREDARAYA